ncbi:hypothetical protein CJ030_MR8G005371 [Morella rubra]|uniref:Heparan-alpha-glucosaminide N-acetyltransferase n=1 Tax=Morella rubra TaxID=262757 RepID=A0A6A1UNV8_9ROSI|nr:hypothetical protein CJ030_MR8G005371 [Morella rubra]
MQLMILVDDAGGLLPALSHAPWNGLTVADLVMPFFLFGDGISLAIRIARAYLPAALCEIWLKGDDDVNSRSFLLSKYQFQRALALMLTTAYLCLLYGLYVPDWEYQIPTESSSTQKLFSVKCGIRGDTGPGCNAVGMINRKILGIQHLYRRATYARTQESCLEWLSIAFSINSPDHGPLPADAPSWCQAPFDHEGLLSSVMAIVTCLLGLHYGHILLFTTR